jgi:hypothetical protein
VCHNAVKGGTAARTERFFLHEATPDRQRATLRDRAEEIRAKAEQMNDVEGQTIMLGIAESYEKLAQGAEKRAEDAQ